MAMKTETPGGETENLLAEAARQTDQAASESSSVVRASRVFPTREEAAEAFARLRGALSRVSDWNAYSDISSFCLFDETARAPMKKAATVGDFVRVSLPGSAKDDWVRIARIDQSPDEMILTIQPSHDPTDEENKNAISHFFTHDSTNNFCLRQNAARIDFYVIGLNQKTNTEETDGVLETIRNYATANLGSFLGVQKKQWETFAENFLKEEESGKVKE